MSRELELVQQIVVGVGGASTIDFTSIPTDGEALEIHLTGRLSPSLQDEVVLLRLNNDSGSNYDWNYVYALDGSANAGHIGGTTSIRVCELPAASATAGYVGSSDILIPNYAQTTFNKTVISRNNAIYSSKLTSLNGGQWRSTSAVTRVTLIPGSGNFIQGTIATLYKISAVTIADKKISELASITTLDGSEEFVVNDAGASRRITVDNMAAFFASETEIDYAERTTDLSVSSTTEASPDDLVSASAHSFNGSEEIVVEVYAPVVVPSGGSNSCVINLWDGSTDLGRIGVVSGANTPILLRKKLTPSNGSHTYKARCWMDTGTATVYGSSPRVPIYIRIIRIADATGGGVGLFDAYALLQDQKSDGSDAGGLTGGSYVTRDLNTEVFDPDGLVTLSSNQFTLQPGTYYLIGRACGYQLEGHRTRIRNITDSTTAAVGINSVAWETVSGTVAECRGRITLTSAKTFELQHYGERTQANTGRGKAVGDSAVGEIYAEVEIWRESAGVVTSAAATDGWVDASAETWTYASATTFTVAGDRTVQYSKGTRIKLTQTTVKYFVVVGSSVASGTTTVTITGGTDYTLANATISANSYSYEVNPQGYPGWFNYTPTLDQGGSVAKTVNIAKFAVVGSECSLEVGVTATASGSSANIKVSLPIAALTNTPLELQRGTGQYNDAGVRYRLTAAVMNADSNNAGFFDTHLTENAYIGSSTPGVIIASGDVLAFSMHYEI